MKGDPRVIEVLNEAGLGTHGHQPVLRPREDVRELGLRRPRRRIKKRAIIEMTTRTG